jgi:hypothetical protein
LSLSVKLGGLVHEAFMSKLKQPSNNSNKNRGGQASSAVIAATIWHLIGWTHCAPNYLPAS